MPQTGFCADLMCNQEIQHLYECHCCSRLVCLNHLIEHVEQFKQNKALVDSLTSDLITSTTKLKLIMEKKRLAIEREHKLIEQAQKVIDVQVCSIDEIQIMYDEISHAIAVNSSEEAVVKVEPSLLDITKCSCVCECIKHEEDQSFIKYESTELKSVLSFGLTNEIESSTIIEDDENSMLVDSQVLDHIYLDRITNKTEMGDENDTQSKMQPKRYKTIAGQCPLTFDGAYGVTGLEHMIRFCQDDKKRQIGLYTHFVQKHKFRPPYALRLVKAVVDGQDPHTRKLFDGNDNLIKNSYRISCPLKHGLFDLAGYKNEEISRVPCRRLSVLADDLENHLKTYHRVPDDLAQILIQDYKEKQMKNS
ncbi:hypothetical protein I4U23_014787 [Adineta vaga]|nr:hypothetical protein I4U23_014787 [Adineta vaga]